MEIIPYMAKYKIPSWYSIDIDFNNVTDEQMEKWVIETNECNKYNSEIDELLQKKRLIILEMIKDMYGKDSKIYKYFKRESHISAPRLSMVKIVDAVKIARRNKEEWVIEKLWVDQKGIDPKTGQSWLTPRMEREAIRLTENYHKEKENEN
ncbi:MAG: hypothetical protein AABY32_04105 [Nanoarchaeota archaeon]